MIPPRFPARIPTTRWEQVVWAYLLVIPNPGWLLLVVYAASNNMRVPVSPRLRKNPGYFARFPCALALSPPSALADTPPRFLVYSCHYSELPSLFCFCWLFEVYSITSSHHELDVRLLVAYASAEPSASTSQAQTPTPVPEEAAAPEETAIPLNELISADNLAVYFGEYNVATMLLSDGVSQVAYNEPLSAKRYSPDSTFKIANSLISIEEKVVSIDDSLRKWDGRQYSLPMSENSITVRNVSKHFERRDRVKRCNDHF